MSKAELQNKLVQLGGNYTPTEANDKLVERILYMETGMPAGTDTSMQQSDVVSKKPEPVNNTKEDILKAVQPFIARGMKAEFTKDTWAFSYQFTRKGRSVTISDSGNMRQPLMVIKRCADMVSRQTAAPPEIAKSVLEE